MNEPPTQVMMKPRANSPIPPGVPPTSAKERLFSMPGRIAELRIAKNAKIAEN
jgi:hypothetical protein